MRKQNNILFIIALIACLLITCSLSLRTKGRPFVDEKDSFAEKSSSADNLGRVWGVTKANNVYTRLGLEGEWQKIVGKQLKNISVGQDGRVWGLDLSGDIYTRLGVNGSWQKIKGKLFSISA